MTLSARFTIMKMFTAFQKEREAVCRDARVDMINVANGGDVLKPVIEFFSRRKKRSKRM